MQSDPWKPRSSSLPPLPLEVLEEELLIAQPTLRTAWRSCVGFDRFILWWRSPLSRLAVPAMLIVSDHIMYNSDPSRQSLTNCRFPGLGHAKHLLSFSAAPDRLGVAIKAAMGLGGLCGGWLAGRMLQRYLGGHCRWEMFQGRRGGWMLPIFCVLLAVVAQALLWNAVLAAVWGRAACEEFCSTRDLGVSNRDYARLTQTVASTCEVATALSVLDLILQDTSQYRGWGVLRTRFCSVDVRSVWSRSCNGCFRLIFIWAALAASIAVNTAVYERWGPSFSWTEASRSMCASSLFLLNLLVITQDWEFPSFSNPFDLKLLGTSFVVDGKWMNYSMALATALVDLYNLVVQVRYAPPLYGQYADLSGRIWTVRDVEWLRTLPLHDHPVLYSQLNWDRRRHCSMGCPKTAGEHGGVVEDFAALNPHANRTHCCGDRMLPSLYVGYTRDHGWRFWGAALVPVLLSVVLWLCLKSGLARSRRELCRRASVSESVHSARHSCCSSALLAEMELRSRDSARAPTLQGSNPWQSSSQPRWRSAEGYSEEDSPWAWYRRHPSSQGPHSGASLGQIGGEPAVGVRQIREALSSGVVPVDLEGLWAVSGQGVYWLPRVQDQADLWQRLSEISMIPPCSMRVVFSSGRVLTEEQRLPASGTVMFVLA